MSTETFTFKFFGWLEAKAYRWVNPDGSDGGIVPADATIHAGVKLPLDAVVGPCASIGEGARIGDGAIIGYRASIGNGASIGDGARIGNGARIGYRTSIGDGASIGDRDWHMTIGPVGSRHAMATAVYNKYHGLRWWVGCKHGISTDQLLAFVQETHGDGDYWHDYRSAIDFVQSSPGLARAIAQAEGGAA